MVTVASFSMMFFENMLSPSLCSSGFPEVGSGSYCCIYLLVYFFIPWLAHWWFQGVFAEQCPALVLPSPFSSSSRKKGAWNPQLLSPQSRDTLMTRMLNWWVFSFTHRVICLVSQSPRKTRSCQPSASVRPVFLLLPGNGPSGACWNHKDSFFFFRLFSSPLLSSV